MCGIAGILRFDGRPVLVEQLEAMNRAQRHRGPDGEGTFVSGGVGLGHCRLAILDPAAGAQPFLNDEGDVALTFNGEIYNFVEIRDVLRDQYKFRTGSDTEVLLRAYQRWGRDCLERLQGMFAFAVADLARGTLLVARDRLGIKPLYYHAGPQCFAFASELLALLSVPEVPRRVNPAGLAGFLRFQYVPTPHSIYREVRKLPPAGYLEINLRTGERREGRYWELPVVPAAIDERAALEKLEHTLDGVVRRYIRSDVPCGSFLSGGVDSSVVTALMARHVPEPPRSFSCGFAEAEFSELPFAGRAARIVGTRHHESIAMVGSAVELVHKLVRHFGEPFGDSSAVPTYLVSEAAARHVKVILSGDGGDELFGGYTCYALMYRDLVLSQVRSAWHRAALTTLAHHGWPGRVRGWAGARLETDEAQYRRYRRIFGDQATLALLNPEWADSVGELETTELARFTRLGHDPVTAAQAHDVGSYMLDDILTKVDRMSMACSLEVRVPLLDHTVAELAFTLPTPLRVRHVGGGKIVAKYILKRLAERFFPADLVHRPKMGFGIPVDEWCRGALAATIEDGLRDPRSPVFEWLDFEAVQETLDGYFYHARVSPAQVWCLMMLALWAREVHAVSAPVIRRGPMTLAA